MGAYILMTLLIFWCAVAFTLNDMWLDTVFGLVNDLMYKDHEFLSMLITCIGLLMALPYLLAMTILQFIFGRFN